MDNTHLELNVKSDNSIYIDEDLKKINLEEYSESLSFQYITIALDEVNEDTEEHKNIAYLIGYFYDFDYIYDYGTDLFSAFNMTDGDTSELYSILFDNNQIKPEYDTYCANIFYINRIYVEKKYRNKGYAKFILNQIEDILKYIVKINVGLVIVCAQPYEKENNTEKMLRDNQELRNRLVSLYKQCDFKEVETNSNMSYLIKICDEF
ncbi:MAG: GNAT family N-acetyltransferase [Ruminococcus sp.]|nr:GNAT family N-acetyltransferase [Ruminococcus sp.]